MTRPIALLVLLLTVGCGLEPPLARDGGGAPPPPQVDSWAGWPQDAGSPKLDSGTPSDPNDADGDGVPNAQDLCSHTPPGADVWPSGAWAGCGSGQYRDADDADRDGVPNWSDKCPGTAIGQPVLTSGAQAGCPAGTPPKLDTGAPKLDSGAPKLDSGTPKLDSGAPPPDTTPSFTLSAQEQDLLDAINDARQQNGLQPVQAHEQLTCAARMHATDYGGGCDHTGSDGSWPFDRAKQCGFPGYSKVNEICAGPGFNDGPEAVWGWSQSSGHWAALVHTQAQYVGLGVGTNGCYVALFDCCVAGG